MCFFSLPFVSANVKLVACMSCGFGGAGCFAQFFFWVSFTLIQDDESMLLFTEEKVSHQPLDIPRLQIYSCLICESDYYIYFSRWQRQDFPLIRILASWYHLKKWHFTVFLLPERLFSLSFWHSLPFLYYDIWRFLPHWSTGLPFIEEKQTHSILHKYYCVGVVTNAHMHTNNGLHNARIPDVLQWFWQHGNANPFRAWIAGTVSARTYTHTCTHTTHINVNNKL